MKLLLLIISLALFSCSPVKEDDRVKAKVHPASYSSVLDKFVPFEQADVIYIDPMFRKGDLLYYGGNAYIVDSTTADCQCGDYQLTLDTDHINMWDGRRLVGELPADSTQALDKLVISDNQ